MSWYTCQAPLNENRDEKSFRNKLTRSGNWKKAVLNQNSSTQTGTGEAKKLFEEKYGWLHPISEGETNRSKGMLTIRTEKDKAAGSNANRKLKNIYKSYSKQKSVIRRYFTLILMFKEGVPDRAPSFCFKIYPEKAVL